MNGKDFITEHIKIDKRERVNKRLTILSKKYKEFSSYLELIQKEAFAVILVITKNQELVFRGMLHGILKPYEITTYLNLLQAYNFIEEFIPNESKLLQIDINYGRKITHTMNFYRLTKKGIDFLEIDYIKEYLKTEYKKLLEEIK